MDVTVDDGEAGMVGDEISDNIPGEESVSIGDKSVSEERSANEKNKVDDDEAKGVVDESVHDSGDDVAPAARVSAGEVMGADECKCAANGAPCAEEAHGAAAAAVDLVHDPASDSVGEGAPAGGSACEGIGVDEGSGEVAVRSEAPCEVEAHATAGDCREKDCPRTLQTALLTMYNLEYS